MQQNKPTDAERGISPEERVERDRMASEGPLPRKRTEAETDAQLKAHQDQFDRGLKQNG